MRCSQLGSSGVSQGSCVLDLHLVILVTHNTQAKGVSPTPEVVVAPSVPVRSKHTISFIYFHLHIDSFTHKNSPFLPWEVFILFPGYFIRHTQLLEAMIVKYITCFDHSFEVWASSLFLCIT